MSAQPERTPAEERREVLVFAAENARADVCGKALEEERKDPDGDVAALLAAQPDAAKGSALHAACRGGHVDVVRFLLSRSAPVGLRDAAGRTPLEVALAEAPPGKLPAVRAAFEADLFNRCASGDADGALALLRGGLDLNCEQAGYTPIAWAALFDQVDVVKRLEAFAAGDTGGEEETNAVEANGHLSDHDEDSAGVEGIASERVSRLKHDPLLYGLIWPPLPAVFPWLDVGVITTREAHKLAYASVTLPMEPLPVEFPSEIDAADATCFSEVLAAAVRSVKEQHPSSRCAARAPATFAFAPAEAVDDAICDAESIADASGYNALPIWGSATRLGVLASDSLTCSLRVPPAHFSGNGSHMDDSVGLVSLTIDTTIATRPGTFRLELSPGRSLSEEQGLRDRGRIKAIAHDVAGLRAAVQVLAQLLRYHSSICHLDAVASRDVVPANGAVPKSLSLPASTLFDRRSCNGAVYMDIWRFWPDVASNQSPASLVEVPQSLDAALASLASWRVSRMYVPIDFVGSQNNDHLGSSSAHLVHMRAYRIKGACSAYGIDLIPVLRLTTSSDLASGDSRVRSLIKLLAQFKGTSSVGVRFVQCESASPQSLTAESVCRLARQAYYIAAEVAGLRKKSFSIDVWISSADFGLLDDLACVATFGGVGNHDGEDGCLRLPPAISVTLETLLGRSCSVGSDGVDSSSEMHDHISASATLLTNVGIPVSIFANYERTLLPLHVWPEGGVRQRARALASVCLAGHRAGAIGAIVEVPTYAQPWCGGISKRIFGKSDTGSSWCGLTAFLAAGITHSPELAVAALEHDDASEQSGNKASRLGSLLAAHLLPPIPNAAELARDLWDNPKHTSVPPESLMAALSELLAGELVTLKDVKARENAVGEVAKWHSLFSERRTSLLGWTQVVMAHPGEKNSADMIDPLKGSALSVALLGIEWLRFACRMLTIVAKYGFASSERAASASVSGKEIQSQDLASAVKHMPLTKSSDLRNLYLRLVERTAGLSPRDFVDGKPASRSAPAQAISEAEDKALRRAAANFLWRGGLRVGAALDLEPWVAFAGGPDEPRTPLGNGRSTSK